jgi:hypothetical protein
MQTFLFLVLAVGQAAAFTLKMGLDPVLAKSFPRDFSKIPKVGCEGAGFLT